MAKITPKSKSTIFISDLHLTPVNETSARNFFIFLRSIDTDSVEKIYILGDLFTLWTGDDVETPFIQHIKTQIREVTSFGIPVFIMPGNRDFLLGKKFANDCNATLLKDPTTIDLYGRKTWLTHGDKLCIKDIAHNKAHNFLQSDWVKSTYLKFPKFLRNFLALIVEGITEITPKVNKEDMGKMVKEASLQIAKENEISQIIHGHLHRDEFDEFTVDNKTVRRFCTGDWNKGKISILVYKEDGSYKLIKEIEN